MSDLFHSLTPPGLIFTVLSVLFAVAAFYISHQRKPRSAAKARPVPPPLVIPEPQTPAPSDSRAAAPEPSAAPVPTEPNPAAPPQPARVPGAAVFRKLSPRGLETAATETDSSDNRYLWE
jgi:hypothetical protein